jgi:alanine racemase
MDAIAIELNSQVPVGTPVTLIGHGVLIEDHARVADTLNYELSTRINSSPTRTRRVVIDA